MGMSNSSMAFALWIKSLQVAIENGIDAFEIDIVFPSADLDRIIPKYIDYAREISEKTGIFPVETIVDGTAIHMYEGMII